MKWLLLTGWGNPGDEWARMGIEKLIKAVDQNALIIRVDKLTYDPSIPIKSDLVVFCGQPLIWSHKNHNSTLANWWNPISSWADENKLILAGYGIYLAIEGDGSTPIISGGYPFLREIRGLLDRARNAYCRSSGVRSLIGERHTHSLCPSIFAGMDLSGEQDLKLCTFMPGGTHYPHLDKTRWDIWNTKYPHIATILCWAGFTLAAHSQVELDYAKDELRWPVDRIIWCGKDAAKLLKYYSRCKQYFGNRIHGGIVARSFGAETIVCGYDTRLQAVRDCGGRGILPEHLDLEQLKEWAHAEHEISRLPIQTLFDQQKGLFA